MRDSGPSLGRKNFGEPGTTEGARDELPLCVLLSVRSASGRSTWPATDVWLTATLGTACESSESVESSRFIERPRESEACERATDRSRTVLRIRRPAPPRSPPRFDPPGDSSATGVPGRPGEGGGDSRARLLLTSDCFTVRTEPEVEVIVRERSGGCGLGEDVASDKTADIESGRDDSESKNPEVCFYVSGLAVTLLDNG